MLDLHRGVSVATFDAVRFAECDLSRCPSGFNLGYGTQVLIFRKSRIRHLPEERFAMKVLNLFALLSFCALILV